MLQVLSCLEEEAAVSAPGTETHKLSASSQEVAAVRTHNLSICNKLLSWVKKYQSLNSDPVCLSVRYLLIDRDTGQMWVYLGLLCGKNCRIISG